MEPNRRRLALILVGFLTVVACIAMWNPIPQVPELDDVAVTRPITAVFDLEDRFAYRPDILTSFNEEPIKTVSDEELEGYRLILLPTFHQPIAVRFVNDPRGPRLVTKILNGRGGYQIGRLAVIEERKLTPEEWSTFSRMLDATGYWELPTLDPADEPVNHGVNGGWRAAWVEASLDNSDYARRTLTTALLIYARTCQGIEQTMRGTGVIYKGQTLGRLKVYEDPRATKC